jgi:hypothetical protein
MKTEYENLLEQIVCKLIATADYDPFIEIGQFVEHGPASKLIREVQSRLDREAAGLAQEERQRTHAQ